MFASVLMAQTGVYGSLNLRFERAVQSADGTTAVQKLTVTVGDMVITADDATIDENWRLVGRQHHQIVGTHLFNRCEVLAVECADEVGPTAGDVVLNAHCVTTQSTLRGPASMHFLRSPPSRGTRCSRHSNEDPLAGTAPRRPTNLSQARLAANRDVAFV